MRPVIGVTTQTLEEIPDELPRCWIMSQRYVRTLTASGAIPWIVPLLDDAETLRAIYERLDGIFLPGGVDIDPESYNEARTSACGRVDPDRDRTEIMLADWAMKDGKPILAVCRGAQLLSVAAGGSLYQDVTSEYPGAIKHDYFPKAGVHTRQDLVHPVTVVPDTRLSRVLGSSGFLVNSMHHQGIKQLAPNARCKCVCARWTDRGSGVEGRGFRAGSAVASGGSRRFGSHDAQAVRRVRRSFRWRWST